MKIEREKGKMKRFNVEAERKMGDSSCEDEETLIYKEINRRRRES